MAPSIRRCIRSRAVPAPLPRFGPGRAWEVDGESTPGGRDLITRLRRQTSGRRGLPGYRVRPDVQIRLTGCIPRAAMNAAVYDDDRRLTRRRAAGGSLASTLTAAENV